MKSNSTKSSIDAKFELLHGTPNMPTMTVTGEFPQAALDALLAWDKKITKLVKVMLAMPVGPANGQAGRVSYCRGPS
jgi:hypothetical protein